MSEEKRENIEDLAEQASLRESTGGSVEFSFDTSDDVTGLVFRESEDAEAPEPLESAAPSDENAAFSVFDIAGAAEQLNGGAEDLSPAEAVSDTDEFIIPDVFEIADSIEQTNPADPYVETIWRPYMPRFTEVTDERRRAEASVKKDTVADEASESSKPSASGIKVEKVSGGNVRRDFSDPTAEIDAHIPDAVVVNVRGKANHASDSINVFKFSDEKPGESADAAATEINPEEIERIEISGLTGHNWDVKPEQPVSEAHAPAESSAITEETPAGEEEPVSAVINDDFDKPFVIPEFKPKDGDVIPEGYEGADSYTDASDTSEYNSFSTRESFKDRFLDSIMAVRIRFIVAIFLGLVTFAFDIFEQRICEYFGIVHNFGAPAMIDACLIASLILISLPETVRAARNLIRGVVSPELSCALVGVVMFGYAISMSIIAPAGGNYMLFASVYAIMVINAIYATHCLQSAHFAAFKVISEKGSKTVIDKPFTRTLELENIALDGLVDEYRSKCARTFDTNFVSRFFANSKKNSEKTTNNLLILAISFGVAVVGALVMLFIKGSVSPVSAISTFALVVALSVPAFSVLAHKLPFYDAEKEASKSASAIIGESSLFDYSGVDVVVFEDTEVFGPDDVTLKSASDRRSDYHESTKKMASLFAALGGPLCRVFENALNKKCSPARDVVIEDDGAEGTVDGERVQAGTADYMHCHGIKIPAGNDIKTGSTRVIYAAADGEFFATFTVHYSFSEEFALLLSAMREEKIIPLIYTRDFNINNDFMRILTGGSDVTRVMRKYTAVCEKPVYGKINSTLVTGSDKTAVINLILTAKRYTKFQSFLSVTEISAAASGAVLAMLVALGNMTASLPMVLLAVWQLGWTVALGIMSRRSFRTREKGNKNAEE